MLVSQDHHPIGLLSPGRQPARQYGEMQVEDRVYCRVFESDHRCQGLILGSGARRDTLGPSESDLLLPGQQPACRSLCVGCGK